MPNSGPLYSGPEFGIMFLGAILDFDRLPRNIVVA